MVLVLPAVAFCCVGICICTCVFDSSSLLPPFLSFSSISLAHLLLPPPGGTSEQMAAKQGASNGVANDSGEEEWDVETVCV